MTDPEPGTPADRPTATPFLAALVIIVLVVVAIGLLNFFDEDEGRPADQQVAVAAVGQNDALQRLDYGDFRSYTCARLQGTEAEVLATQRESAEQRGERFVDDVAEVKIDGDRATATVTYHFDKAPDAEEDVEMTFVREGGVWKVCSSGPR